MGLAEFFFGNTEDIVRNVKEINNRGGHQSILPQEFRDILKATYSKEHPVTEQNNKIIKPNIFRPTNFEEYIGQIKAKEILKHYIDFSKERGKIFPHTLLVASAGYGKTTLARIIAKELEVKFKEIITSEVEDFREILDILRKLEGGILFLDEIHSLERNTAEKFYTIMEDFTHENKNIEPFTLMGATTELGELIETRKPFIDRFLLSLTLEDYNNQDLVKIGKQYNEKMYGNDILENKTIEIIAENSRGTPRTVIRLLEACIRFDGRIREVLKNFGIVKKGFTNNDIKVLKYILSNEKGVGLQGISAYLGISTSNYLYSIEPYLLRNNMILRSPRGRKITGAGINFIKTIKRNK